MKNIKKIGIACGVLLVLLAAALLLLEFVIDLTPYIPRITKPISDALHRTVTIETISHTILRGPGASLRQVTISEPDHTTVWANASEITAKLRLIPLLSKRIEISKIALKQPDIVLKRASNGVWNIADWIGQTVEAAASESSTPADASPTPEQPAVSEQSTTPTPQEISPAGSSPESTASASTFAIDAIQLSDGTLRIIDELMTVTTEITDVNASVKGMSPNSPIRFDLSAGLQGGTLGQMTASGKISPLSADGKTQGRDMDVTATLKEIDLAHFQTYLRQVAQLRNDAPLGKLNATMQLAGNMEKQITSTGTISVDDVNVDVAGKVEQATTTPILDLTISSKEFPWEKLMQLLPPNVAKPLKDLGLTGKGTLNVQPKGSLDNLALSGEFDLSQSGMYVQKVFAKPEALAATLKFEITIKKDVVDITVFRLAIGKITLEATGSVSQFSKPVFDVQLTSNTFPLPEMLAIFPEVATLTYDGQPALKTDGMASLTASVNGAVDDLAVSALVNLDKSAVTYADIFSKAAEIPGNITAEARVKKDGLSISRAVVNLGDFQLTAQGDVTNFNEPALDLALETNLFDIAVLFGHFPMLNARALPKELRLDGACKIVLKPVGSMKDLAISGMIDMTKGGIVFGENFTKPKDIPGIIEFDTVITPDAVNLKQVRLNLNDVLLDITGAISGLRQETMLDLTVTSNQFAFNQLLPFSGMEMNPTGVTEFSARIKGPADKLAADSIVTLDARCQDVGFQLPALGKPVQHLNLIATLRDQTFSLKQFSVSVGESSLKGEATIASVFTAPDAVFALQSDYLNADEFLTPPAAATTPQARFDHHAPASPFRLVAETTVEPIPETAPTKPGWLLSTLKANGTISVARGIVEQVEFANLRSDVTFKNQVLNLENMLFELYDGRYEGRVEFDLSSPDPKYAFESKLVQVDTNRLLTASVSAKDIVYGLLFANAAIAGQGFSPEQLAQHLSGNGAIRIGSGKLTSFHIWPEIAQIFDLLGTVGKSDTLRQISQDIGKFPDETNFSRFEATFDLDEGKGGRSDILLEVPEQDIHIVLLMNGTFDLDLSLDFLGKIRFTPESKYYHDLQNTFRDFEQDDGSIELPFPIPVGGTLFEPAINLNTIQKSVRKFAEEMAKQAVKSEIKDQLEQELGKTGNDLLQQIFK